MKKGTNTQVRDRAKMILTGRDVTNNDSDDYRLWSQLYLVLWFASKGRITTCYLDEHFLRAWKWIIFWCGMNSSSSRTSYQYVCWICRLSFEPRALVYIIKLMDMVAVFALFKRVNVCTRLWSSQSVDDASDHRLCCLHNKWETRKILVKHLSTCFELVDNAD